MICEMRIHHNTKHCFACNRCCQDFDHHCFWLNNCIGKRNYKHFLASTIFVFMWAAIRIPITLLGLIFAQDIPLFWIMVGIDLGIVIASGKLIWFHFYIWRLGITTFTWIKFQNQVEEKQYQV